MQLGGETLLAFADLAFAQESARYNPLIHQQLKGIVELLFVLFHKIETAAADNFGHPVFRDLQATKLGDPADRPFQIPHHIFIKEK